MCLFRHCNNEVLEKKGELVIIFKIFSWYFYSKAYLLNFIWFLTNNCWIFYAYFSFYATRILLSSLSVYPKTLTLSYVRSSFTILFSLSHSAFSLLLSRKYRQKHLAKRLPRMAGRCAKESQVPFCTFVPDFFQKKTWQTAC